MLHKTVKKVSTGMISAVNNRGLMRFMCFAGALNAALFIMFLHRLIGSGSGKLFLIVDSLRVHHSVKVTRWVDAHRDQIEMFFLPPSAPEHNPDESLNNEPKQRMKNLPKPDTRKNLVGATAAVMRSLQRRPERIRAYLHAADVRYAA